jgi:predicted MFS family arabinose efflux permease
MIIGLVLIAGLAIAWALGARLSELARLRFRGDALVFVSLGLQLAVFTPLNHHIPTRYDTTLHLLSYLLLVGFFVLNVRLRGFWLVGSGVFANALVIAVNGGRMPVALDAWRATGADASLITATGSSANNVLAGAGTHLAWLGDVFPLPPAVPFSTVISIGDILMLLGMVAFVYRSCAPRPVGPATNLLAPLRSAAFRRVLTGRLVSGVGDWLAQAAVVTWIYAETHSTYLVAAFLVSRIVSVTVGGLASAPLLDRVGGFRVLSWVESLRGVLALVMVPLAMGGRVWPVIVVCGVSSFLSSATNPSAAGLVPDVLSHELLQAGNALHNLAPSLNAVLGAAAGGFLVIQFGIGTALAVDLVTFVVAAALYRSFADHGAPDARAPVSSHSRRALLRMMARSRVVLSVTASFALATAAFGLLNAATAPLFDLRFDQPDAYGYVAAMLGVGYLFGEVLTGLIRRQTVVRRSVSVAFVCTAAAASLLSAAPTLETAFLAAFMLGAADGVTEVGHDTLIQLHSPAGTRAGMFAMANSVERVGMLLGLLLAPVLVAAASPEFAVRIAAGLLLLAATVAAAGLVRRQALEPAANGAPKIIGVAAGSFALTDSNGHAHQAADLAASAPIVVVLLGDADATKMAMVTELGQTIDCNTAAVLVVADPRSSIKQELPATRDLKLLQDSDGSAHAALGVPAAGLGRRSSGGVFVLDQGLVVRFAFVPHEPDQWIPASFVLGRLARMAPPKTDAQVRLVRTNFDPAMPVSETT